MDVPLLGELKGVHQQIGQHLGEFDLIGLKHCPVIGQGWKELKVQPLGRRLSGELFQQKTA